MKSNYKRLGDLIIPVSVKNTETITDDLRGVNYQKYFMPSVTNTVGVDLSSYKVVNKVQFACNLMHVGRDECLPIAMHREEKPIIVSPAYFSFEVENENEILSEFLFLWFKRAEFDREACFYTDADVRQGLIKSSFMNIQVPVPPIEEQRRIVAEYQAVERRIENNHRLIATLEDAAQTIYRKMFVDNIDPNNLPKGWRIGTIGEFCNIFTGKKDVNQSLQKGKYPFFSCAPIPLFSNEFIGRGPAILIAGNGSYTGRIGFYDQEFDLYQRTYACENFANASLSVYFLYFVLKSLFEPKYLGGSRGTSIPYIVKGDIADFSFYYDFNKVVKFEPLAKQVLILSILNSINS